ARACLSPEGTVSRLDHLGPFSSSQASEREAYSLMAAASSAVRRQASSTAPSAIELAAFPAPEPGSSPGQAARALQQPEGGRAEDRAGHTRLQQAKPQEHTRTMALAVVLVLRGELCVNRADLSHDRHPRRRVRSDQGEACR